ncbi:hypothetical protein DCS_07762 [Drechmeria coniospora]|uniref:Secreted protein n=1 Tax=Drechmeria coniospora TaxID=98403 RepID=A0A151GFD3_DRECN|nr:hypothetical protein DCS_07762 [Drechmeria coniospora]KYK55798.1 hypothetical protein DCS_07762 [Drechmeria coniospora]ODA81608.1 hypothetical protein RJ55_00108 [Drechmeria coniospora]
MHISQSLIFAATLAKGVIALEAPIPGYGVEVLQWDVVVSPGKVEVLNGTIQEVYAQALQINPDFKIIPVSEMDLHERRDILERRPPVECGIWPLAEKFRIEEGIGYLRGLEGSPSHGPGPGICARVSCSYNAAIWWCNDNTNPITLDKWYWLADSAQHIVNTCAPYSEEVSGKNVEGSNWYSFIGRTEC